MSRARSTRRLRWAFGLTGVVVVVLAFAAFAAYQALQVRSSLVAVASDFQDVAEAVRSGDQEAARSALDSARDEAARADDITGGVTWGVVSRAPMVGDDAEAVRTVADVSHTLADDVLAPVVDASAALDPAQLRPRNGRIPLAPVQKVAPAVVRADRELQRQAARVDAIETSGLLPQLAAPVEQLQTKLTDATVLSSRASLTVRLLPPMLGADGPRTYLVLFQNNAEVRATGGMPGALAVLRVNRGRLSIVGQGTAQDLGYHPTPPLRLTRQETDLYEKKLGQYAADLDFTPDFPRAAQIARAMWRESTGQKVDGVLSADPVALSYLLKGTGPVQVPGGPALTASNAVDVLLSDIYRTQPDYDLQNAFFASAAKSVFDAVASGKGDPAAVLEALTRGVEESRLYAWSAKADEQRLLGRTALGGAVPQEPGSSPYVGVFLNDGTGAKMQYYLDHRVDVRPVGCNPSGRQRLEVTVTLTSHAPANAAQLPPSVIGPREGGQAYFGVSPGNMRMNVHLYAPIGGWIDTSAIDGEERPLNVLPHLGHQVGSRTVELAPGQTRKLTYTVMSGLHQPGDVDLRVTPGVRSDGVGDVAPSACSPR